MRIFSLIQIISPFHLNVFIQEFALRIWEYKRRVNVKCYLYCRKRDIDDRLHCERYEFCSAVYLLQSMMINSLTLAL